MSSSNPPPNSNSSPPVAQASLPVIVRAVRRSPDRALQLTERSPIHPPPLNRSPIIIACTPVTHAPKTLYISLRNCRLARLRRGRRSACHRFFAVVRRSPDRAPVPTPTPSFIFPPSSFIPLPPSPPKGNPSFVLLSTCLARLRRPCLQKQTLVDCYLNCGVGDRANLNG
jgi:hypothetical protein